MIRERGLRAEDVDVVPGAAGGPKWLVLEGLDRFLFGEFFQQPRERPLHLIGASIGSWRTTCMALRDPAAGIERLREGYIEQHYAVKPAPAEVTRTIRAVLDGMLGETGEEEVLTHPWARLHVITAACRGPAASERAAVQMLGLAMAAAGNLVSRRTLGLHMRRVVFNTAGDDSPFRGLVDLPTEHRPLTRQNLRHALLASGSIPMVLQGVPIPGEPAGIHRDGGVIDYHLDLDFGAGPGIVLYPHFYAHVVPGWFDKGLAWRRARWQNFGRALILAPTAEFVARLPGGKIPDRNDFYRMPDGERVRVWRDTVAASAQLADELRELIATGRVADAVRPL
jgi:hypothetical protein